MRFDRWKLPACAALLLSTAAAPVALRFDVDGMQSAVTAKVAFFGLSSKTAHFPRVSGSIHLSPQQRDAVALDVTLDATALIASDTVTTGRLKGANFFDVARYPTVHFAGDQMRRTGPTTADVTGQLTAHGIARQVTLAVIFSRPIASIGGQEPLEIEGRTTIDRRDFGMTAYPLIVGRNVAIAIRAHMVPAR